MTTADLGTVTPAQTPEQRAAAEATLAAAAAAGTTTPAADQAAVEKAAADKATADATAAAAAETARKDAEAQAAAKAPEKYALTLPENAPLTATDLVVIESEAKALGLSSAQAQTLVAARATHIAAQKVAFEADLMADPELGGANITRTMQEALAGRDVLFPPGSEEAIAITDWFNRTGYGSHKALVRAFARLGRMNAEDTPAAGATQNAGGTLAQSFYPGMNP